MTESPPAESGWAWCRSLNFWLQLLAWLFFVLLFLHIHKCPRADALCVPAAVVPRCPPGSWLVLMCCARQPELHPPLAKCLFLRNDKSTVFRVQLPTAVYACSQCLYPYGVNTVSPFVLKRDPWTMSALSNPIWPSHSRIHRAGFRAAYCSGVGVGWP